MGYGILQVVNMPRIHGAPVMQPLTLWREHWPWNLGTQKCVTLQRLRLAGVGTNILGLIVSVHSIVSLE